MRALADVAHSPDCLLTPLSFTATLPEIRRAPRSPPPFPRRTITPTPLAFVPIPTHPPPISDAVDRSLLLPSLQSPPEQHLRPRRCQSDVRLQPESIPTIPVPVGRIPFVRIDERNLLVRSLGRVQLLHTCELVSASGRSGCRCASCIAHRVDGEESAADDGRSGFEAGGVRSVDRPRGHRRRCDPHCDRDQEHPLLSPQGDVARYHGTSPSRRSLDLR
jgi:hypothetical protein